MEQLLDRVGGIAQPLVYGVGAGFAQQACDQFGAVADGRREPIGDFGGEIGVAGVFLVEAALGRRRDLFTCLDDRLVACVECLICRVRFEQPAQCEGMVVSVDIETAVDAAKQVAL